jgi:hypothetical protein
VTLGRALRAAGLRVGARPQPVGPEAVAAQLAALQRAKAQRLAAVISWAEKEALEEETIAYLLTAEEQRLRTLIEKLAPESQVR